MHKTSTWLTLIAHFLLIMVLVAMTRNLYEFAFWCAIAVLVLRLVGNVAHKLAHRHD